MLCIYINIISIKNYNYVFLIEIHNYIYNKNKKKLIIATVPVR